MIENISTVMVTGASGNLGSKAVQALLNASWCKKVIGLYPPGYEAENINHEKLVKVSSDLTDPNGSWNEYFNGLDAIIHFAAQNPVPEANWNDAIASFDMTANLSFAALKHGVKRFVFCSSNHVMGGYKDAPLANTIKSGGLTESLAQAPGTKWSDGDRFVDSTPYASYKLMGERTVLSLAEQSSGKTTVVCIRVGWALPDENNPKNISMSGSPNEKGADVKGDPEMEKNLHWFRDMWLSNADLEQVINKSLTADSLKWPSKGVVVNAVSNNKGTVWGHKEGVALIGFEPQDDLYNLV